MKGYVIAPDDFTGTLQESYADDDALAANNLVFLPAAGYRSSSFVCDIGTTGGYWSSTAEGDQYAYGAYFDHGAVCPGTMSERDVGFSVRLVTEVN